MFKSGMLNFASWFQWLTLDGFGDCVYLRDNKSMDSEYYKTVFFISTVYIISLPSLTILCYTHQTTMNLHHTLTNRHHYKLCNLQASCRWETPFLDYECHTWITLHAETRGFAIDFHKKCFVLIWISVTFRSRPTMHHLTLGVPCVILKCTS